MKDTRNKKLCRELRERFADADGYMDEVFRLATERAESWYFVSDMFELYNDGDRRAANENKRLHIRMTREEIVKVTQFFTPENLCRYVAVNSLSRRLNGLFAAYDGNELKSAAAALKVFDPAAGTGNLLYAAYRVLYGFYTERLNLSETEAKALISGNLSGADIDKRAVKTAKRLFKTVCGFEIDIFTTDAVSEEFISFLKEKSLFSLADAAKNISDAGSLSLFSLDEIPALREIYNNNGCGELKDEADVFLKIAAALTEKYDIILINPPYLASSDYNAGLKAFVDYNYKIYGADLFGAFTARCLDMLKEDGYLGAVCPYNWMFLKKFAALRARVIEKHWIANLAMLPNDGYKGATVFLSAFVIGKKPREEKGGYLKPDKGFPHGAPLENAALYKFDQKEFLKNPYCSLIFWTGDGFRKNYGGVKLSDVMEIRQGLATGDNKKYLRRLDEVSKEDVSFDSESVEDFIASGKTYAPYNKGGKYRKWYGNLEYVIRFDGEARTELARQGNKLPSSKYYFKKCITWTLVSSKGHFGARISGNSLFDVGGSCGFPKKDGDIYVILGYLCGKVATYYLNAHNPTMNCQVGDIKNLPYIEPSEAERERIEELVKENIEIARRDWHGLYSAEAAADAFKKLKANEEELNGVFIRLYGLEKELDCSVDEKLITVKSIRYGSI